MDLFFTLTTALDSSENNDPHDDNSGWQDTRLCPYVLPAPGVTHALHYSLCNLLSMGDQLIEMFKGVIGLDAVRFVQP